MSGAVLSDLKTILTVWEVGSVVTRSDEWTVTKTTSVSQVDPVDLSSVPASCKVIVGDSHYPKIKLDHLIIQSWFGFLFHGCRFTASKNKIPIP